MGRIAFSSTDINGNAKSTEVRTNRFEDFILNTVYKLFGREIGWRLVHYVEKRKLRK